MYCTPCRRMVCVCDPNEQGTNAEESNVRWTCGLQLPPRTSLKAQLSTSEAQEQSGIGGAPRRKAALSQTNPHHRSSDIAISSQSQPVSQSLTCRVTERGGRRRDRATVGDCEAPASCDASLQASDLSSARKPGAPDQHREALVCRMSHRPSRDALDKGSPVSAEHPRRVNSFEILQLGGARSCDVIATRRR